MLIVTPKTDYDASKTLFLQTSIILVACLHNVSFSRSLPIVERANGLGADFFRIRDSHQLLIKRLPDIWSTSPVYVRRDIKGAPFGVGLGACLNPTERNVLN